MATTPSSAGGGLTPDRSKVTEKFVAQCLDAEAEGDGALFRALFGAHVRYCTDRECWYIYTDGRWQRDNDDQVFRSVSAVVDEYGDLLNSVKPTADTDEARAAAKARRTEIERRIRALRRPPARKAALEFAWKGHPDVACRASAFDADPYLLGVCNGTLDLRTGLLLDPSPADMITKRAGARYVPWEQLPTDSKSAVANFLVDIWGGDHDKIQFFQRLIGQALIGEVVNHVFPFLIGHRARNGKTVLCTVLSTIFGDYAITFRAGMLYDSPTPQSSIDPEMMEFEGARLAISSEVKDGVAFSSDRIKLLTGGDTLKGRNPYELPRAFRPSHTLLMVGNHEPTAPVGDPGFWDRTLLITCPYKFVYQPSPDPSKKERQRIDRYEEHLLAHADAFLSWFVEGALLWQADNRRLQPPESVTKATEDYRADSDWIGQFVDACTTDSPTVTTRVSALYNAFAVWYAETVNRKFVPSQVKFSRKMRELGRWDWVRRNDGMHVCGLELSPLWVRRGEEEGGV